MRSFLSIQLLSLVLLAFIAPSHADERWVEGKNYFRIQPAQPTTVPPGKVEVTEVLSYGCPACYRFLPIIEQMKKQLPPQAQLTFVHASFNAAEQWPMFQRAFYTAQQLNILDKTHEAMFKAVWGHNGELAVSDANNRIKSPPPTIEDAAKFYAKTAGIDASKFLAASKSFGVDMNIRRAETFMKACQVDQTPTIIVNGKYRLQVTSAGGVNELLELVNYLVQKESLPSSAAR
ncbi:MAG: thiol:disulfide interchange protein DsbA/DsbL [Povalibacter sp.]|jgi:thiol:disulfide interchange protein DsbA